MKRFFALVCALALAFLLPVCAASEQGNSLDLNRCIFRYCVNNGDGSLTSNFEDFYFCTIELPLDYINDYVLVQEGKPLVFSCDSVPSDTMLSVTIYGSFSNGKPHQEKSSAYGVSTVTIVPTGVESFSKIELRFNRKPQPFTDMTTVFTGFKLLIDPDTGSGGSGGSGVVSSSGGSGGLNDFTRIMSNVLGLYKLDLTIYGYTFSLWQVFIFSMLIGIVVNFIGDLIFD